MDALIIDGPATLEGTIEISGSKNTALPLLFSSLLFDGEVQFRNVPRLWDIETTLKILESMGAQYIWDKEQGTVAILPLIKTKVAPYEWVRKMRAGVLALGPLLAKYGEARVSLPGGCAIGARPVNFHLDAMRLMGVGIEIEAGYIRAQVNGGLRGTQIEFPQATVTGTENIMMLATRAEGKTIIRNAALEPEVVWLGGVLKDFGVKITGLGTPCIEIEPRPLKRPDRPILVPPDRIEASTLIAAAVAARSSITVKGSDLREIDSVIQAYQKMGVKFKMNTESSTLEVQPPGRLGPVEIETAPFPGFPTDMQAQILTNACMADGTSLIHETIFENRFMHVAELRRLRAKIQVRGNTAIVDGPAKLIGAPIMATDLRASACLLIAGLAAKGQTRVSRIYHLDRGYQRLDEKLKRLGAKITRIAE